MKEERQERGETGKRIDMKEESGGGNFGMERWREVTRKEDNNCIFTLSLLWNQFISSSFIICSTKIYVS